MSTSTTRFLTGITTTGTPHLGNYVGAIRPAVQSSLRADVQSYYFLADYHALIKCDDPVRIQRSTLEIAATWLAAGLDPERVTFYRQSDIPEIPELTWLLTCVTGKGLLNRAHAYKASVDKNLETGQEPDDGVTAGLFMYPVLMAADILMFKAHKVPVGRDQIQHIEMARDIASSFNHLYGKDLLVLPEAVVDEQVALLPGLDGRKMSKSYDNTIPLFVPQAEMKKRILSIVTDSRAPGEPKDTEGSALFQIYQAFATPEETAAFAQAFADGIAWGEAKQLLFERIDREIAPMRARYAELIANPAEVERILLAGAEKARVESTPYTRQLREAAGLRSLAQAAQGTTQTTDKKTALPVFKQYREQDGQFYFKLSAANGEVLLQSKGYANPRDAAGAIAALKQQGAAALAGVLAQLEALDCTQQQAAAAALQQLLEAAQD